MQNKVIFDFFIRTPKMTIGHFCNAYETSMRDLPGQYDTLRSIQKFSNFKKRFFRKQQQQQTTMTTQTKINVWCNKRAALKLSTRYYTNFDPDHLTFFRCHLI